MIALRLGAHPKGYANWTLRLLARKVVNNTQRGVDWQMKIDDARTKLISIYPKIKK